MSGPLQSGILAIVCWLCAVSAAHAWEVSWTDATGLWRPETTTGIIPLRHYDPYASRYMLGGIMATNVEYTGDLSGSTITFTVSLQTNGSPDLVFGGEITGVNRGPLPPQCRLMICANSRPFRVAEENAAPFDYWWSADGWVSLDWLPSVASATVTVHPVTGLWTSGNGKRNDAEYRPQFLHCLANVKQVGLLFGGGSFFDVGVAVRPGTGQATFTLQDFVVTRPHPPAHALPPPT